jgi:hypothetical protein
MLHVRIKGHHGFSCFYNVWCHICEEEQNFVMLCTIEGIVEKSANITRLMYSNIFVVSGNTVPGP